MIDPMWVVLERVCDVERSKKLTDPTSVIDLSMCVTKYMNPFENKVSSNLLNQSPSMTWCKNKLLYPEVTME